MFRGNLSRSFLDFIILQKELRTDGRAKKKKAPEIEKAFSCFAVSAVSECACSPFSILHSPFPPLSLTWPALERKDNKSAILDDDQLSRVKPSSASQPPSPPVFTLKGETTRNTQRKKESLFRRSPMCYSFASHFSPRRTEQRKG